MGLKDTQETQIAVYEKGATVGKEAQTAEFTAEGHGFVSLEESMDFFSVESMDVITTDYDAVDQGCFKYPESG